MTSLLSRGGLPGDAAADAGGATGEPAGRHLLLGAAALLAVLLVGLLFVPLLYIDVDGMLGLTLVREAMGTGAPWSQSRISAIQGMGAQAVPIAPLLVPGYAVLALGTKLPVMLGSYLVFAGTLFAALVVLGGALRLGAAPVAIAAQLACLLLFPPLEVALGSYHQVRLNPGIVHEIAVALLLVALIVRLGTRSAAGNGLLVLLAPALVLYGVLCDPLWLTVPGLSLGVYFLAALFVDRSPRTDAGRAGGALATLLVLAALAVPSFYRVLMGYTARARFRTEILGVVQDHDFAYLPLQNPRATALFVLLLGGALLALRGRHRPARIFAIATVAHMALLCGLSLVFLYGDVNWTFPLPVYFQQPALPVYLLVAVTGWREGLARLRGRLPSPLAGAASFLRRPAIAVSVVPAAALALVLARVADEHRTIQSLDSDWVTFGDQSSPFALHLRKALVPEPGGAFRGLAVTLSGGGEQARAAVGDLLAELWITGIPTLEEYGQLISPPFHYLMTRGLGRPEDGYADRNRARITVPRLGLLRALGVRYLVAFGDVDGPLRGDPSCRELPVGDEPGRRLYELARANRGDYSPVLARRAGSAREIVGLLLSPGVDLEREVIVTEPVEAPLVAARASTISFVDGGLKVSARSEGRSLLLLPLQYSHALRMRPAAGARLLRANLAQTGLLFEREIDTFISLDFGFGRTAGRAQDLADLRALGIGEDGSRILDPAVRERRHPHRLFRPAQRGAEEA
jgi:hypothetical protein